MKPERWGLSRYVAATVLRSPQNSLGLLLLGVLALVLAPMLAPIPSIGATGEPLLRLGQAEFIFSDSSEPPSDSAAWRRQILPDNWLVSRPGVWGYGWYRLHIVLPVEPDKLYAAYVPLLQTFGALYVNGVHVGQTGPFERTSRTEQPPPPFVPGAPPVLLGHPPQLFSIRHDLLHAGPNTVHLRLWVKSGTRGALSGMTIGPEPLVRAVYERRVWVSVTGPQMIVVFSAGFGLFILLMWLRRRHETMYGYAALTALAFTLFVAGRFVIAEPPIPFPYWGVLVWAGLEAYIVLMCLFALRYGGWRWPRLERWLWAYLVASPFLDYASFVGFGGWVTQQWWLMTFVLTIVYVAVFWTLAWQRRTLETLGLAIAGSIKLVISANERLLSYPIDLPRYQPFAYVPMFIMIGWILIDRFVRSLNDTEKLNAELEQRVAEKHAELARNYQRMQMMERQQAIVEERSRIMRDMHDGIGAQLISALSLVEHGELSAMEVAAALRECLDDLRLTIDSLEPTENDLLPVMGNLRYRLDGRLRKQGIELDWQVSEVPGLPCLTPQNVLHILRILQEAFTNIVKHAHATSIRVETGLDAAGEHVYICVRDNGTGFCGERTGRGIASMRHRAKVIGGRLDIQPSAAGTTLNLLLPVS
ncbi:signal transduction histidine kinase [Bradyrhizobium sp. LB7.1]